MRIIVEPIVISKLFLDNEIIALIKIPYVTTCNNIYYFYINKKFSIIKTCYKENWHAKSIY